MEILITRRLTFKTKTEEYAINIYYEVEGDVEQTEIYKAFKTLIETHKN